MKYITSLDNKSTSHLVPDTIGMRAGRNFFWMLISEGVAKGTIIVINIYIARVLAPSSYGVYSLVQSVALYLSALILFGTGNYGQREISKTPENAARLYTELMGLRFLIGLFIFGIFSLFILIYPLSSAQREIFFVSLILPFGLALKPDWVFRGLERIHFLLYGSISMALVVSVGTLLLVKEPQDIVFALIIRGGAVVVAAIVLTGVLIAVMPISINLSLHRGLTHLKECVYFGITIVLQSINNELIIVISGIILVDKSVGIYAAPHRIVVALGWIAMMFGFGFYPVLSAKFVQSRVEYKHTFQLMSKGAFLIAAPVLIVGMSFSRQIIRLLLGFSYAESGFLLLILLPCFLIDCLAVTFSFGLISAGHQKFQALALVIGFTTMLSIGLFLIPNLEETGSALAYLFGKFIYLIILIYFFFRKIGVYIPESTFLLYYLFAIFVGLIPIFLPGHWLIRTMLSLILFSSAVFLTKILSLAQFKTMIKNII